MSSRRRLASLALVALLPSGCLARSPQVEFYTLRAVEAPASALASSGDGLAVTVGPLRLPRFLDRPQLARRSEQSQIRYDEFQRWASPLEAELLRVLSANLSALLGSKRVVAYPAEAPGPAAYRVTVDIESFEAGPDDTVTLRARWAVLSARRGEALRLGRVDLDEPARSGRAADLVAAHSAAAGALSRAIADGLRATAMAAEASSPAADTGGDEVSPTR